MPPIYGKMICAKCYDSILDEEMALEYVMLGPGYGVSQGPEITPLVLTETPEYTECGR